jgi:hypothetical protein
MLSQQCAQAFRGIANHRDPGKTLPDPLRVTAIEFNRDK